MIFAVGIVAALVFSVAGAWLMLMLIEAKDEVDWRDFYDWDQDETDNSR